MPSLNEFLLTPLDSELFRHGLAAAVLVAITCAPLGVHVILRRMSFIGDALAHATLPGLVLAWILEIRLLAGGLLAAVLAALSIGTLSRRRDLAEDSAIGIVMTGALAAGVIAMAYHGGTSRDLTHLLFGNILGIALEDLYGLALVAACTLGITVWRSRTLALTACDPTFARTTGLNPERERGGLLVLIALAVVTGAHAVGVILVTALLITPAATARLVTRRLGSMTVAATIFALLGCLGGLWLSYWWPVPTGAAIVTVSTGLFLIIWALTKGRSPI